MPFFVPLVTGAVGFVVRKRVAIVAGALVYTYYDEAGRKIGEFVGEEAAEKAEKELNDFGITVKEIFGDVAEGLGNVTIEIIENAGIAIVKALDKTADFLYDRTISGKESTIITNLTAGILTIGAMVYLYQSVKHSRDAFE
tara:strand:+ start:1043 stop:1465 length:423 start_codon:yes stop_codon:yes gene_type:complete